MEVVVTKPLDGVKVVSLAPNLPGPAAAAGLHRLGAQVTKVETPAGDFMEHGSPSYYAELTAGQKVLKLDLKSDAGQAELRNLLADADVLVTSHRPAALARLGLDWTTLHREFPKLIQLAIVGYPGEDAEKAGHDLTYQAVNGTLTPPALPRVLVADLAGAERGVAEVCAALFARTRTDEGRYCEVALSDLGYDFAAPYRHGLTSESQVLGGGVPRYNIYAVADGFVALAALEEHFWQRFAEAAGVEEDAGQVAAFLAPHTREHWQQWAAERDIPLDAVAD